jgi:hypothetical protein
MVDFTGSPFLPCLPRENYLTLSWKKNFHESQESGQILWNIEAAQSRRMFKHGTASELFYLRHAIYAEGDVRSAPPIPSKSRNVQPQFLACSRIPVALLTFASTQRRKIMKWLFAVVLTLSVLPATVSAQRARTVSIGNIPRIESGEPTTWAMSGFEMIRIRQSDGSDTPMTRSLKMDARTVEILSRVQAPPLRARDVKVISNRGRHYIVVRNYLLTEVKPQDARAEKMSQTSLARKWASATARALPQVAPQPGLGI